MSPPVLKILYGPPGTGKTYRAAREAIRIITGNDPVDPTSALVQFKSLVDERRIWWVTFHPSYTYEDFVEGFRPKLNDDKQVYYEVEPGPFKLACSGSMPPRRHNIVAGAVLNATGKDFTVVRADDSSITVNSKVTRKDAVADEKEETVSVSILERLRDAKIAPEELSYSGKEADKRRDVAQRAGLPVTFFTSTGPIRAVYPEYLKSPAPLPSTPSPVVIVIDEINRADLSRVFGELITLLEPDKRLGAVEERRVFLPYSKTSFGVPANVSLIGTMNTADRSLAMMDFALRRRFEFVEVAPDPSLCPKDFGGVDVGALLAAWNDRITNLRSREHRLGHSELMAERMEQAVQVAGASWPKSSAADTRLRALAWAMRTKVVPTLLEYFHEDWRKCRMVLGPATIGLMSELKPVDGEALYEDVDVTEGRGFELPEWWDPRHPAWDGARFLEALKRSLPPAK